MSSTIKNTPKLRFPEFNETWEKKKLGEMFTFKVTNSFSRENLNYDSGKVKNIHYGDIHTKFPTLFDITKSDVPFINNYISIERINEEIYCLEGDLIFADASEDINDVGKSIEIINLNNERLLSGLHTILARPKKDVFQLGFKGYLFKSDNIRLQIQKESQGTKVLSISAGRLSNVKMDFPSLPEQQKIASFLTAVDDKLQALKKKKAGLERYKKGVMQQVFSQKLRFKDDTSTELSAGDGKDFPEWEMKKLGEIGITYNGISGKSKDDFGSGKPYIQYKQIFDDSRIDITRFEFVKINANETQNKVQFGDVFFTTSSETPNEIGMSSVLLDSIDDLYLNSFCFGYRINSQNQFSPYFAQFLFRSFRFRASIMKLAQGSTRFNLSKTQLMKIEIELPSLPEQTKIANFLSAIDDKIQQVEKQISGMELWKKGLLQQLFV